MKEEDLIRQCRYYGKPNLEGDDNMFSFYESCWVNCMLDNPNSLDWEIREYIGYGLEHFSEDDSVPIGIKAILFNRYSHWSYYLLIDEFKDWYLRNYLRSKERLLKEWIGYCKYYNGEEVNPFKPSPKFYVWTAEKEWVKEMGSIEESISDEMRRLLSRYEREGYGAFELLDGIPKTLKAVLFSLVEKWNEGVVSKETFADFYNRWKIGDL